MKILIVCGLVILSLALAEYPPNVPKCKNGDSPCLTKVANEILQKHFAGLPELNLVPLDPLHVKKLVFERTPSSPNNINITFTEFDTLGFKNMNILSLSGFNAELSGRTTLEAQIPELRFVGSYKIDDEILELPVVGEGPSEVIMKNIDFEYSFELKAVEKNGETYATLEHDNLSLVPGHAHYQLDNLYNGDKARGDVTNALLNEHWSTVYEKIKQTFEKEIAILMKALINAIFEKYPYAEYFE